MRIEHFVIDTEDTEWRAWPRSCSIKELLSDPEAKRLSCQSTVFTSPLDEGPTIQRNGFLCSSAAYLI